MAWNNCEKKEETVCFYFDKTSDPATWPNKLHADVASSTGYAFGSLVITGDSREGFEVPDKVWLVKDKITSVVFWIDDNDFKKNYKVIQ